MARVLVVDDSDTMRQLVHSMLEPEGYVVRDAADGLQALDVLRASDERQVVLLDYHMPNMNGWELLQVVASEGGSLAGDEYIVITTDVSTFPPAFIELLRNLSIRILPKPFGKDVLAAIVAQAAERLSAQPFAPIPEAPEA